VIWTFALFWFLFYNSFDATYLYDYTFIVLYNVVFTSLPVIALGGKHWSIDLRHTPQLIFTPLAFDQDLNAKASLAFPQLYREGIKSVEYTKLKFWAYMVDGLYQSAIIYFIPLLAWQFGEVAASWNGRDMASLADFGTTASVCAIFAANQYVGINTR
jgi:phospholipid-translocating ATPase